jgi:hypothetical protein
MGSSEADAPAKASKASIPQEQQPPATSSAATPVVYPDWTNFQRYSPIPPHGFFPSPVVSSPQGHPYMWGPQPMMPPYGTPPYVIYPPGGIYAHPSMPPGAHPFAPYAMNTTNGNPDVTVRQYILTLSPSPSLPHASNISRELPLLPLVVKQMANPLKEKKRVPLKDPKEV